MALRQLICSRFTKHVPNNIRIVFKTSKKVFFYSENIRLNFPNCMDQQINYMTHIFIENF